MDKQETKRQRGAQTGNSNAVKHGRYRADREEKARENAEFYRLAKQVLRLLE